MSISVLTVATIQNRDDLLVSHSGPDDDGKYCGWITFPPSQNCHELLNTEAIFDTKELAQQHMHDLINDIKRGVFGTKIP